MNKSKEKMTLREVQLSTLEILKVIHKVCEKLGISYFLMYGSLIGAIRHKGFIPWDDDLDIGMKRKDYDCFLRYIEENQKEFSPFVLHNASNNPDCFYSISRMCDTRYYLEYDMLRYTSGTFVDIYPLDGMGTESDLEYWNQHFTNYNKWQKGIYFCCAKTIFYGGSNLTKFGNIPFSFFSRLHGRQYYLDKFNDFKKFEWNKSEYVGVPVWEKTLDKRNWYDNVITVPFEDTEVYIPAEYDKILRSSYGDYLKLPPKEKQVPSHGYTAYKVN